MANEPVTQKTELTGVEYGDILYIIDDPGGTPVSKKCTAQNAVKGGASQGAISAIIDAVLTTNKALVSDANGKIIASAVTATELGYISGLSSAIQTQLNNKSESSHNHSGVYEPSFSKNTAFNKNFGTGAGDTCQGNDSRLSDSRTPVSHGNTYHSETFITSAGVTYENLLANSDVGTASTQLAQGDHTHSSFAGFASTDNIVLSNTKALQCKDTGGTARNVISSSGTTSTTIVGNTTYETSIQCASKLYMYTGGTSYEVLTTKGSYTITGGDITIDKNAPEINLDTDTDGSSAAIRFKENAGLRFNIGYSPASNHGFLLNSVSAKELNIKDDGYLVYNGTVKFTALPTSNPAVAGALWNDSGTLKVSAG